MKGQPVIKKNMQILRDVLVHKHVHTLHRPEKALEKNFALKSKPENDSRPADTKAHPVNFNLPASTPKTLVVDRYDEGFLAGKMEAHSQAVREVEKKLQAELDGKREQLFQEAYKLGQQQGFASGQKEGLLVAQKEAENLKANLSKQHAQLEKIFTSLPERLQAYMQDAEDELVALSFSATSKILGESLSSEMVIRELVNSLVKQHLTDTEFSVHLHPDDYALLSAGNMSEKTVATHGASKAEQIRWVSDASIKLGGLIIRSSEQSLDARLDFQIEVLKQGLLQARQERKSKLLANKSQITANVTAALDMPPAVRTA
ncbi:FliH/SctL family protein [Undibacterium sp. Di27W]|uniref:FliH/SctL family protein n=1 Tax=Undibacterium sp. Di27W TaxID=3413036 RepID=UPI003BF217F9